MSKPEFFIEKMSLDGDSGHQKKTKVDRETEDSFAAIERSNAAILSAYPAEAMRNAVRAKLSAQKKRTLLFPSLGTLGFAAAACCVLAVSFLTFGNMVSINQPSASDAPLLADRAKGSGPNIFVYLKDGDDVRLLPSGSQVKSGDTIQISYIAGPDAYGAIVSIDGTGSIFQHYPESGDLAASLSPKGEIPLEYSYQLDDAPRFERFLFVSAPTPFSTGFFKKELAKPAVASKMGEPKIPETLEALLADALPNGAHITEILLLK